MITTGRVNMTAVDRRTRRDDAVPVIDPEDFFDRELPSLFVVRAADLPTSDDLPLRTLVVDVDERAWCLRRDPFDRFSVDSVDTAAIEGLRTDERIVQVRLTAQQVSDLVNDQITPIGMMTAGALDLVNGRIGHLLDWWLVLRSVLDGVPIYRPGSVDLPDDLGRSFTLDDDPHEIRAYLESAGYLHLRGVFTADEMARISADMDRAAPSFSPGDGRSWWATLADGSEQVVRMQHFESHSPTLASILDDPRFLSIADLVGAGHTVDWATGNRAEALFKPIGVASGISDVPWHKDCSLGRHSYECCSLTVGISITGAGPTSGQLRVIAGSHRALLWPSLIDTSKLDLPDVALPTDIGDVTVHLSCTLHMAQEPTETPRRVVYTGFRLPNEADEQSLAANRQRLKTSREGAPLNTSQVSATSSTSG